MILVTGATGSTGGHLVSQLKERNADFKALVRDHAKGKALGADYAVGDFDDPASLADAMVGADRLFLASPGAQAVAGEQPMIRWEQNVIDAAAAAGVQYVVKLSILHAAPGRPMSEGGHGETEAYLKASGLEWTMLQPGGFMQNFLAPSTSLADDHGNLIGPAGEAPVAFIDAHDIAAVAAALLTGAPRSGESHAITGPAALTYREIAAELSRGRGHHVGFVAEDEAAIAERLRGFGMADKPARELASLYGAVGSGAFSKVTDAVERLTGTAPRGFDQFMTANPEAFPALVTADENRSGEPPH